MTDDELDAMKREHETWPEHQALVQAERAHIEAYMAVMAACGTEEVSNEKLFRSHRSHTQYLHCLVQYWKRAGWMKWCEEK